MPRPTVTATPVTPAAASDLVLTRVVREESGRITAALTASFRSLDIAEESVAEASRGAARMARARNPAQSRGLAHSGRAPQRARPAPPRDAVSRQGRGAREPVLVGPDWARRGRPMSGSPLLFGCCHPALAANSQLALTLRAVCGLTTVQIARATLTRRRPSGSGSPGQAQDRGERDSAARSRSGRAPRSGSTSC